MDARMSEHKLRHIVEGITYKTGWRLNCDCCSLTGQLTIQWDWDAPDAEAVGETCVVTGRRYIIEKYFTEGDVLRTIFDGIRAGEMHEAHEFFRYDGNKILDPHWEPSRWSLYGN